MTRAGLIVGTVHNDSTRTGQSDYPLILADGTIYKIFGSTSDRDLFWAKSADDGLTWSDPVLFFSGTFEAITTWYDKWTPGNTGTLFHVAWLDTTNDIVLYRALDTADDSMGTQTTILDVTSTAAGAGQCLSITRAIGGNLYCLFDTDGGVEDGFYRSTDIGATWGARDNTGGSEDGDYFFLLPNPTSADTNDILCIFWDRSADELTRKNIDDSANTFASETSIAGTMLDVAHTSCSPQFAVTLSDALNLGFLVAWSARDTANADLRFWTFDESTITEGTPVVLNSTDDQQCCAIALDTATGDIYVFYLGKSDGSETVGTSLGIYYKVSTDDGATWGSETAVGITLRNYSYLMTCPIYTGDWTVFTMVETAGTQKPLICAALLPESGGASMLVHPGMSGGMRG
jgi:hypothetical protein